MVELLGFLGGGIGMFYGLPQARRVRTLGHGRGVSLVAWLLMLVVSACWTGYGIRTGAPSVIVTNTIAGVINGSVVVALVPRESRPMLWMPLLAVVVVLLSQVLPEAVLSTLLIALVFSGLPQLRESWESRRAHRPSAVSMQSLYVALVSLVCWGAYAVIEHLGVMMITTTLATLLNGTVLLLERTGTRTVPAQAS